MIVLQRTKKNRNGIAGDMGQMKELLVLRVKLADSLSQPDVEVALELWGNASKEVLKTFSFLGTEFGLHDRLTRQESTQKNPFACPSILSSKIETEIDKRYDADNQPDGLWLKFDHPSGYLNLVPWEQHLQPSLKIPILRLPKAYFSPDIPTVTPFDIVIFASAPRAKGQFSVVSYIEQLVYKAASVLPKPVFHVFVDADNYSDVLNVSRAIADFKVYDPNRSSGFSEALQSDKVNVPTNLENPWLRWMLDELSFVTVDSICFVGHGYFSNDRGSIALAQSPLANHDSNWARFVGANELSIFMSQLGAWNALFSSIENNFSFVGLKSVGFELANLRPGPIVVHDIEDDDQFDQLAQVLSVISSKERSATLTGYANIVYQSPYAVREGMEIPDANANEISSQAARMKIAGATTDRPDSQGIAPAWKIKASRYLQKRSVQQAASNPQSKLDSGLTIAEIQNIVSAYKRDDLMGSN